MAWEQGWSERHRALPPGWVTLRKRVLKRDGGVCQARVGIRICGAPANQVDHIVGGAAGRLDNSMSNLQALCEPHHRTKTGQAGGKASGAVARARAASRKRPEEPHPGRRSL